MELKLFRYIVGRVDEIDDNLRETGAAIGESRSATETINLRTKSYELLAAREELRGVLKTINRPIKTLETINYINNEDR